MTDGWLITFATLHPNGALTDVRRIALDDVLACPLLIMVPEHFRADGSCRCVAPTSRPIWSGQS